MEHYMNMILLLVVAFVALAFAAAWFLAFSEGKKLRGELDEARERHLQATAELERLRERARNLEDARAAMGEQFKLMSQQALETSAEALRKEAAEREKLALERVQNTLKPVAEHLVRFEAQVKEMEGLKAQLSALSVRLAQMEAEKAARK